MAKHSLKSPETEMVRKILIERGIGVEKFAADCGVKAITVQNQISKNFPSRRLRLIVEDILQLAIWSAMSDFSVRQQLSLRCGFDAHILSIAELRQRVASFAEAESLPDLPPVEAPLNRLSRPFNPADRRQISLASVCAPD